MIFENVSFFDFEYDGRSFRVANIYSDLQSENSFYSLGVFAEHPTGMAINIAITESDSMAGAAHRLLSILNVPSETRNNIIRNKIECC